MAIDKDKWSKMINEIKNKEINYSCAEKILVAYENPKTSIKWVLLYKYVDSLDGFYDNEYIDDLGYEIGLLRNLIFDTKENFLSTVSDMINNGWIYEQGAHQGGKPVVENLLKRERIID